jgi:hypothetical protein
MAAPLLALLAPRLLPCALSRVEPRLLGRLLLCFLLRFLRRFPRRPLQPLLRCGRARLPRLLLPPFMLLASGCAAPPALAPASALPPAVGLVDILARPAERALFDGMRAYDDGQYPQAESALRAALAGSLRSPRDQAVAYKLLAFIFCTSNREFQCEAAFKSARDSDAAFQLSRAEAGHPLWGPVYRRVARLP